jgi:hypothetical protein
MGQSGKKESILYAMTSVTGQNSLDSSTTTSITTRNAKSSQLKDESTRSLTTPTSIGCEPSSRQCLVNDCDEPAKSRGWCRKHYQRWCKTGDPEGVKPGRWDGYERPVCFVDGCGAPAHAQGLCTVHISRFRRHGDPLAGRRLVAVGSDIERFHSFVTIKDNGCWAWNGGRTKDGYGEFQVDGMSAYAHRWSYAHHVGPIPPGLVIDHTCHNNDSLCPGGICAHRACVNAAHLEPVTLVENFRRGRDRTVFT